MIEKRLFCENNKSKKKRNQLSAHLSVMRSIRNKQLKLKK